MRAISSHPSINMRVLILSAVLAYAVAAPSGYYLVGVVPNVPAGDIQAAVIDAQVKLNDHTQFICDQAVGAVEVAAANQRDGLNIQNDLAKEQAEEAVWAAEEKRWQDLNAAQVAQAKLEADAASQVELEALGNESAKGDEQVLNNADGSKSEAEPESPKPEEPSESAVKSVPVENAPVESAPVVPEAAVKSENPEVEVKDEKKESGSPIESVAELTPEARQLAALSAANAPFAIIPSPIGLHSPLVASVPYTQPFLGAYTFPGVQYAGAPLLSPIRK